MTNQKQKESPCAGEGNHGEDQGLYKGEGMSFRVKWNQGPYKLKFWYNPGPWNPKGYFLVIGPIVLSYSNTND